MYCLVRELLENPDFARSEVFRPLLHAGVQELIDAEAAAGIAADHYGRTLERATRRRHLATLAGEFRR